MHISALCLTAMSPKSHLSLDGSLQGAKAHRRGVLNDSQFHRGGNCQGWYPIGDIIAQGSPLRLCYVSFCLFITFYLSGVSRILCDTRAPIGSTRLDCTFVISQDERESRKVVTICRR